MTHPALNESHGRQSSDKNVSQKTQTCFAHLSNGDPIPGGCSGGNVGHVKCEVRGRAESGNGSSSRDGATIRWGKFVEKHETFQRFLGENASTTIDAFHVRNTFQFLEATDDRLSSEMERPDGQRPVRKELKIKFRQPPSNLNSIGCRYMQIKVGDW